MFKKHRMATCLFALLSLAFLSATAFGQSTAASLGGTVLDTSRAVLPGANITAVNQDTGVETKTTTNNSGVYNFPSIQPGTYRVTAETGGFQRSTRTEVRLGSGSQIRLDFELAVAGTTTEVEVTSTVEHMVLESGSSTGTVMQQETVAELPLVSNDAIELIHVMGGVVRSEDSATWADRVTFAGVTGNNINIARDGISVNEIRYNSGITSPARLNPEMVGEFKMILSPVDAEMGRGAGQIQMTTRSGTNAFHASGVWNIQNTALDAYDFDAKHVDPKAIIPMPWRNVNNYVLTASGPIIQNRTFFFVTWDHVISKGREDYNAPVLTDCARKGIYRWLSGTRGANALADPSVIASTTPRRPTVDLQGTPLLTYQFPEADALKPFSGLTHTAELRFQSVLGELTATARNQIAADPINCSQYLSSYNDGLIPVNADFGITGNWDDYRNGYDQSGFVSRFTALMPRVNNWQTGDGLNTGGHLWTRRNNGISTLFGGNTFDDNRKAVTFKIDHNINAEHRVSGTYSYEYNIGDDGQRTWPGTYGTLIDRKPSTFTLGLTSTLAATLLNELRVGWSRTESMTYDGFENPQNEGKLTDLMVELLGSDNTAKWPGYANLPVLAGPGRGTSALDGGMMFHAAVGMGSAPVGSRRNNLSTTWGGKDQRWTFADTITWMKGAHSFKGGVEYRWQQSWQKSNGNSSMAMGANAWPAIAGGELSTLSPFRSGGFSTVGNAAQAWPDMPVADADYTTSGTAMSGNYTTAHNLLTYMSGSVGTVTQWFYAVDAKNPRWNDPARGDTMKIADLRNREFSWFFKDDWKFNNSLTLNLGVRHEYYGSPWENTGMAAGPLDGFATAMGMTEGDLSTWMPTLDQLLARGNNGDNGYRSRQGFVGPHSPNPDIPVFNRDLNNFAPHVGFSWQLPWFGEGQTTLRGGYSISYTKIGNYDHTFGYSSVLANAPGLTYAHMYYGSAGCFEGQSGCYLNFENVGSILPLYDPQKGFFGIAPENQPTVLGEQPVNKRDLALQMYDPNIRNPYIQNLNLSLTRQVGRNLTVDVRYIGTLYRKGIASTSTGMNLNTVNLINSGLMDALQIVRKGGESDLLNRYIPSGTLYRANANDTTVRSGSEQVRQMWGQNLANGAFVTIAGNLAVSNGNNYSTIANQNLAGVRGTVLRAGGAPENWIYANPQYGSVNVRMNRELSNYHSMQAQVTLRPTRGINFQATYTWSRNIGRTGAITDYTGDWTEDYFLALSHRSHQLNVNGMWSLPFGPNGFVLRNVSGAMKKAVEGWHIGWIASANSGVPIAPGGAINTLWANGAYDMVGPFDTKSGKVEWDNELADGFFFGKKYTRIIDPQCFDANLLGTAALRNFCGGTSGLKALVEIDDSKPVVGWTNVAQREEHEVRGTVIFQNTQPGHRANFQGLNLTGPGRWSLDANMGKSVEFMEGKRIEFRLDAQNIFNHANPSNGGSTVGARGNMVTDPFITINTSLSDQFGLLRTKTGHRTFQGRIRLSF